MEIRDDGFSIFPTTPQTAQTIGAYIAEHRTSDSPFDIIVSRALPEDDAEETQRLIAAYTDAGVTWILRDMLPWEVPLAQAYDIIRKGPPQS